MARPQIASDEAILNAARRVIARSGYDGFTLSAVAEEVGLSRAALILRFKSTQALKMRLAAHMYSNYIDALNAIPNSGGGHALLEFAAGIGTMISSQEKLAAWMTIYRANFRHPDLATFDVKRWDTMRAAISARMPPLAIDHDSAVLAFGTHIGGCTVMLESRDDLEPRAYMIERTKDWLTLVGIPYDKAFADRLLQESTPPVSQAVAAPPAARRVRGRRRARR